MWTSPQNRDQNIKPPTIKKSLFSMMSFIWIICFCSEKNEIKARKCYSERYLFRGKKAIMVVLFQEEEIKGNLIFVPSRFFPLPDGPQFMPREKKRMSSTATLLSQVRVNFYLSIQGKTHPRSDVQGAWYTQLLFQE